MTNIDQFESVFKAADKPRFAFETIELRSVLIVTDLGPEDAQRYQGRVAGMLKALRQYGELEFTTLGDADFETIDDAMWKIETTGASIVCLYRNLKTRATRYPFTLGTFVDVVTQASAVPVLLLPRPDLEQGLDAIPDNTDRVMAITDHLTGDHHLVSMAAAVTQPNGTLYLTHVEDEAILEKFVATIGKIPSLNTEVAGESIRDQLLKEPHDYIQSCRQVLASAGESLVIQEIVTMGHQLRDYERLVQANDIDLLVMNTKDHGQLAMHGVAYPLAVELRNTPMLML